MAHRTAFFISDGTGITAEALGHSLLAQFNAIQFTQVTLPYIDTPEKAREAAAQIDSAHARDGEKPIVIDTIVDDEIRRELDRCEAHKIDVFSTFINPLEKELGTQSSYSVGTSHGIQHSASYKSRIDSVNYAMDNDDGARIGNYSEAEVILVGVSRCGKTPTCLYMALQFGLRAANYPLTEEDLSSDELPKVLQPFRDKLYGLTIDPFQLAAIRHERRPNSRYASLSQCKAEVRHVEKLLKREGISSINTTQASIEEIATRIIANLGLERRI